MKNVTTTVGNRAVVSPEEWTASRIALLKAEKELTHRSDEVARMRQQLPCVEIHKNYMFDTDNGKLSLEALFDGRSQLLVYHFMFGPDYAAGCASCSSIADSFNGITEHLKSHDVMLWAISRAPLTKLQAFKSRMGWSFPWASSFGSNFNYDFGVSYTEEQMEAGAYHNYKKEDPIIHARYKSDGSSDVAMLSGTDLFTYVKERPGMSAFIREGDRIFHTYSAFERGVDILWNMYQWLDRAPLGRNENSFWLKHHDQYNNEQNGSGKSCCH